MATEVTFTPGTEPLLQDPMVSGYRYLVLAGGRASSKSWSVARALLIRGCNSRQRWLCARELQNSIAESVHKLLADQVQALNLGDYYQVQRDGIYGRNGTEFFYMGLRNDPQKVKSTEGLDGAWLEEGQSISEASWDTLDPTVRKTGSQIIVTYNPRFETDTIHVNFANPATRLPFTWYKELNYLDNPWLSDVNRRQAEHMRVANPLLFEHIWMGKCVPNFKEALWPWAAINDHRLGIGTEIGMARVVVGIDPAVTANKQSDETGIIVAGCSRGTPRHFYVLSDQSGRYTPAAWARQAMNAYDAYDADALVFEVNQGGDLVLDNIRNHCREVGRQVPRLIPVRASRGKVVRAEPIAALYGQGLVHHVGPLPDLERQLLQFNPVAEDARRQKSPDRVDALVWTLTELAGGRSAMSLAPGVVEAFSRLGGMAGRLRRV